MKKLCIENAKIILRNFSGKPTEYNPNGGHRTCGVLLPESYSAEMVDILREEGWNIRETKVRDEYQVPRYFIPVEFKYGFRPPKIVIMDEEDRNTMVEIGEDEIDSLDWMDIEYADVMLNPYEWSVRGTSGVKAYVSSMYVHRVVDELSQKYAASKDPF